MCNRRRDVDRILSIEPSASGAGKKAAYDASSPCEAALGRGDVDDLAACGSAIARIGENVRDRDVRVPKCELRADAMRIRKGVSRVKEHNGALSARAPMW